ncbi:MAG TPA: protein-L-isoaspartate(D-aspartate) O-methyltransferase [Pseudomonadales bacterium]|nr:protein-L-isoaspartate(D-aspartate) O-methyltransferase [Pseudomonadales bacterium]
MSQFDLKGIGMTSQRTRDRLVQRLRDHGVHDARVLDVIRDVPRHIFIDEALAHRAYEDTALPIGHGQTISQPFIVALMTQTLLNVPRARVLEIGTGSGYQTAVLAALVERVYTVERIAPLLDRARDRFRALKLRNVRTKYDDGNMGWADQGPFDGIIVTAAARTVPDALIEQLAPGGRLVIPVGDDRTQELKVIDRGDDGIRQESLEYVRFVPLLRGTQD